MVKTSTQKNIVQSASKSHDLKPSKAVIHFLVNYSKALEIKKTENGENLSLIKN